MESFRKALSKGLSGSDGGGPGSEGGGDPDTKTPKRAVEDLTQTELVSGEYT
jgi:hypothetical protein